MRKEIVEEVQSLEDDDGRITPQKVVDRARSPTSILHPLFEWDDRKAGESYRVDQARQLLRTITFKRTFYSVSRTVYAYLRDPEVEPTEQGYRSTIKIMNKEDVAREAVDAEFAAAASRLRRARDIAIILGFADEISERIAELMELRSRMAAASGAAAEEGAAAPN